MKVKFRHSELGKEHTVKESMGDFYILESHPMNWSMDCFVAVRKTAVDLVIDTPTYKVGQRFHIEYGPAGDEYLLAQIDTKRLVLINIEHGGRWSEPVEVKHNTKVTEAELMRLTGNYPFTLTRR